MTGSDFTSERSFATGGRTGLEAERDDASAIQVSLYIIHWIMVLAWVAGSYHLQEERAQGSMRNAIDSHLRLLQTDGSSEPPHLFKT